MRGFEPLTSASQTQYAANYTTPRFRLRHQGPNLHLLAQSQLSYLLDDPVINVTGGAGVEPTACGFGDRCSTS
jgi:hypothetical protein